MAYNDIKRELDSLANKEKARLLQGFFKTGKGEYGEGDIFLGIMVPKQRAVVKKYWNSVSFNEIQKLLSSKIHEYRLTALLILVQQYKRAKTEQEKQKIFDFYLKNTKNINNWDLVDLSAPNIVGDFLKDKDRKIIYKLAKSNHLWEKRIAVLATFAFIREKDFADSLKMAEMLLHDKHDLIHKAVGWMLREIGKRDKKTEEIFLKKHCASMPRTMLRYAIEKFPENKRKAYLNQKNQP